MQRVLHQDIVALARCLMRIALGRRENYGKRCVEVAYVADGWRRINGRAHPLFGDGTLQSACTRLPRAKEGYPDDPDYAKCLVAALNVVINARSTLGAGNAKR